MKRPDRFSWKSCGRSPMSARRLRWTRVTVKPVRSGWVESLRGRMGESMRQVDELFESLLAEAFADHE